MQHVLEFVLELKSLFISNLHLTGPLHNNLDWLCITKKLNIQLVRTVLCICCLSKAIITCFVNYVMVRSSNATEQQRYGAATVTMVMLLLRTIKLFTKHVITAFR